MFFKNGFITVNLKINFVIDFAPHYAFVLDNKCYNMRTGRFIRQTRNNGSIGYIIDGKPYSWTKLKPHLVKYSDRLIPKFEIRQPAFEIEEQPINEFDSMFEFLIKEELVN